MKIAIVTDTHFGARNDNRAFMEYFRKFYENIFFPHLLENNITRVFHLGDIVDRRKYISYTTLHDFHNIFIRPLIENNIELDCLVGNHDIPFRNTNSINAMNELFGHHSNAINLRFYDSPAEVDVDGLKIAMIPWINHTNYNDTMEFINKTNAQFLFGHLELNGFEMYRGMKNDHGMATDIFSKFDTVCSGHFHHKSSSGNIHYLGNPYEMTWNDFNDERGFHILDTETRELEFIRNPYRMFHKYVYDDKETEYKVEDLDFNSYNNTIVKVIVKSKTNPYIFDLVMDKIYASNPSNVSIVDDNRNMDMISDEEIVNEAEDTLTSLRKYINMIETDVEKSKIDSLITTLYTEAQTLDIA